MGRFKVIFRLLIACAICGVILWWLDRPAVRTVSRSTSDKLFPFPLREVNSVMLEQHDGRQLEFRKDPSGWVIVRPAPGRALDSSIMQMLDAFERAPLLDYIDSDDIELRELSPADFGFRHPFGRIVIRSPSFRTELKAGDCDAVTNGFFVAFDSLDGVCVTDPSLRQYFTKAPIDFMDRHVLRTNMRYVMTVILQRPALGDIKLVRDGKYRWKITQPFEARADWDSVVELFQTLKSAKIEDVEGGVLPESVDYGFDRPDAVSVRLFGDDDLVGQTLVLGYGIPGTDYCYARTPDNISVVTTGAVSRAVTCDAYAFCDKRVFPSSAPIQLKTISVTAGEKSFSMRRTDDNGWDVTSPVTASADHECAAKLTDAILSLSASRLVSYDKSFMTNRVASVSVASDGASTSFDVFDTSAQIDGTPALSVVPAQSTFMYVVPVEAITNITRYCTNPVPLVSRTVISIPESGVRAVTVTAADGTESRIERMADKWMLASAAREADASVISRFFACVAALESDAVVSLASTSDYSTDGGSEIAFDMADGTSLRRILKIGPRTDEGHYVTVKGRDAVFIISHDAASILLQPFRTNDTEKSATVKTDSASPATN